MKASEALLLAILSQGGGYHHMQLKRWEAILVEKGYLETDLRGQEGEREVWLQLTEKGRKTAGDLSLKYTK